MRWAVAVLLILVLGLGSAHAQSAKQPGQIVGRVMDATTRAPLIGATVVVEGSELGAATDLEGGFRFENLERGAYSLRVSYVGYESTRRPDIIVRPGRATSAEILLEPAVIEGDAATVTAAAYSSSDRAASGLVRLTAEEVRRAPGSAGDVNRALASLPSVAKVNDMRNGLIVRGGSPSESAVYIDGIQIPNLNHFPTQGSTDGAISMLNTDLIREVSLSPGGFAATYGGRLSSVMDIDLRDGNPDEFDGQFDMSLAGAGFIAEGGMGGVDGSWLISARRSYLDFLVNDVLGDEVDAVPTYSDIQGKVGVDVTSADRVYVVGLAGFDASGISRETAIDEDENTYGDADFTSSTVGVGWQRLLGLRGLSTTTLSHSHAKTAIDFYETLSGDVVFLNSSREYSVSGRNVTHVKLDAGNSVEFGAEGTYVSGDYDQLYGASTDVLGNPVAAAVINDRLTGVEAAAFATLNWQPLLNLTVSPGARVDYFTYNDNLSVSPRLNVAYHLTAETTIRGAWGLFRQRLPGVLLAQVEANKELPDMEATHVAIGVSQLLTENTLLTIDAYWKGYNNMPVNPSQPGLFTVDEVYYQPQPLALYSYHEVLEATGKAETIGVEALLQKKIVDGLYGQVGASYSRSRYQWPGDDWRPRVFDNRLVFSGEGGYKLDAANEFSIKWVFAGGAPYTPFDEEASAEAQSGIFEAGRINDERLPHYHSLSLRYDRRFHFSGSTLVAYIDIWNVYGRKNVSGYTWNQIQGETQEILQFGTLPIIGLEFEF